MVITSNAVQPARAVATNSIGLGPVPPAGSSSNMWWPLPDTATNWRSVFNGCVSTTLALIIFVLLAQSFSGFQEGGRCAIPQAAPSLALLVSRRRRVDSEN